jgi:hypothetical protein
MPASSPEEIAKAERDGARAALMSLQAWVASLSAQQSTIKTGLVSDEIYRRLCVVLKEDVAGHDHPL